MLYRKLRAFITAIGMAGCGSVAMATNLTPELQLNGFATAGGGFVSDDFGGVYAAGFNSKVGLTEARVPDFDNVLGIQLGYQLSDRVDLVGQLVAKGRDDYSARAEWVYAAYRVSDALRVRGGRFAAPLFMYSETLSVGQAYPWVRTPVELYAGIPFSSLDGVDLLYRRPLGAWDASAQLFAGGASNDVARIKNTAGLNINLTSGGLTLRAGYSETDVSIVIAADQSGSSLEQTVCLYTCAVITVPDSNPSTPQDYVQINNPSRATQASAELLSYYKAAFTDVGFIFDDGAWFLAGEIGVLRYHGWGTDTEAGFVSAGHYFGRWLPYATAAKVNTVHADECFSQLNPIVGAWYQYGYNAGLSASGGNTAVAAATGAAFSASPQLAVDRTCSGREQTSYSVGFRYDVNKNVSVKAEVSHVQDFNGTNGLFQNTSRPVADNSVDVFSLNVNAAF